MIERMYWTSRSTKDLWHEESPGVSGRIYFPYATQFMKRFPWLAIRVFWLMVKLSEALNIFITNYPPVCPDLFRQQSNNLSNE